MAPRWPETSRKAVKATSAVLALMAEPRTGPVWPRPAFLRIATTPKHTADRRGRASCPGRMPSRRPPIDSKVVPATITTVPARMGRVTCSPSSSTARPVETRGFRLISAAEIEAPTFSMLTKRRSRPPVVPMRPASANKARPWTEKRPNPSVKSTAIQRPVVPTTRLIQKPVNGVPPRRPWRMRMVEPAENRAEASAKTKTAGDTGNGRVG